MDLESHNNFITESSFIAEHLEQYVQRVQLQLEGPKQGFYTSQEEIDVLWEAVQILDQASGRAHRDMLYMLNKDEDEEGGEEVAA